MSNLNKVVAIKVFYYMLEMIVFFVCGTGEGTFVSQLGYLSLEVFMLITELGFFLLVLVFGVGSFLFKFWYNVAESFFLTC